MQNKAIRKFFTDKVIDLGSKGFNAEIYIEKGVSINFFTKDNHMYYYMQENGIHIYSGTSRQLDDGLIYNKQMFVSRIIDILEHDLGKREFQNLMEYIK